MDAGLALLTGASVERLLAEELGEADLVAWRVRSVDHRPGAGTTVAYDVTLRGPDGPARQLLAASTGASSELWRFPHDPGLPALPGAADESAVRELLAGLGVEVDAVRLDVRTYRPRRRAVVEVRAPRCRLFLKVVRPEAVAAVRQRHVLLRDAGLPVPRVLGWTGRGLLVLEALRGTSLRTVLRQGGPAPGAPDVLRLLDRLPPAVCDLPRRRSWADEAPHYARVLAAALPAEAERAEQLARRVRERTAHRPADVPTHGDLYDGQLLVDGGRITGLLDVETAGPGRRADDLACVLAHLVVSDRLSPPWLAEFERAVDPGELRARVAGVLLSLATGPYRVQSPDWQAVTRERLDLAESWV